MEKRLDADIKSAYPAAAPKRAAEEQSQTDSSCNRRRVRLPLCQELLNFAATVKSDGLIAESPVQRLIINPGRLITARHLYAKELFAPELEKLRLHVVGDELHIYSRGEQIAAKPSLEAVDAGAAGIRSGR